MLVPSQRFNANGIFLYFQMKDKTYRRLSEVNTVFIKYNLLVGVENLGLADCNKYYVSFYIRNREMFDLS